VKRRKFSETDVIETLAHQGIFVPCHRCRDFFFYADPHGEIRMLLKPEREHLHEIALGGADTPRNCRYSCERCHAIITNGYAATSAGSSKQRIAKVKRLRGETKGRPKTTWPKRKLRSANNLQAKK
jgi:hypothetical protein